MFRVAELPADATLLVEARREVMAMLRRHGDLAAPELGRCSMPPASDLATSASGHEGRRRRVSSRIDRLAVQPVARGLADLRPRPRDPVRDPGDTDLLVLDLFCGTGALAIEAISRGADSAVLVDRGIALAQRNVTELGIANRCELVRSDATCYLERSEERFGLILCDPPYRLADRLEPALAEHLPPRLAKHGRLAVECRRAARSSSICHCSPSAGSARR